MNILIVDDERVQRESLKRGLRRKGYWAHEAVDAREALKWVHDRDKKIDLVLTDFAMPGMNGIELLKEIRKDNSTIPVIMMTAYGEKDLVIEAMRNRCDRFIEKPFTLDQLLREIRSIEKNQFQNTCSDPFTKAIPRLVHQINNPLTSIMGMAELGMLQSHDKQAIMERMGQIIKATEKIKEINEQMLRYGQSVEEKMEAVDIHGVLEESLAMFSDLLALKGISVEKHLDEGHRYISGNRFGIEQAFKNLIANAIDAMDGKNEKRLKVSLAPERSSSFLVISVEDTGSGIAKEDHEAVFESYFTKKENGTGLGLAVVLDIIERHGGRIDLRSEVGKGACFRISLPAMGGVG